MLYFVKTILEMKHINVIKDVINLNALQMSIEHNLFSTTNNKTYAHHKDDYWC